MPEIEPSGMAGSQILNNERADFTLANSRLFILSVGSVSSSSSEGENFAAKLGNNFIEVGGQRAERAHRLIMVSPTELKEGVTDIVWLVFR